ncbi:MAG: NADH-ubiquinone oxidoreductase-F iron-sulfur binding region domain-containing protein [Candidatus Margulisiibacteriota bacterium]
MKLSCSVERLIEKEGNKMMVCDDSRSKLLPILQEIQDRKGFVSDADMQTVADSLGIHPVEVFSVATFYSFFNVKTSKKHTKWPDSKWERINRASARIKNTGPLIFDGAEPFAGLKKAVEMGREKVLAEVRDSELKGRGGAGFPTGAKWSMAAEAQGNNKFVICNADEGEPGTFKDRVLLMKLPELVLEGMLIAAYAIKANIGYLYLRGEYRFLLPELNVLLEKMRKESCLGKNILGQEGFDFNIEIRLGSGAYVCGEESSLLESIEGQRGEPRNRPPFPVSLGLHGDPTVINNVETLAVVPGIISRGSEFFKSFGTERSRGTKLLSVSGDCAGPGVYEVPFGTSLKEVLKMAGAKNARAAQVGGASGVFVTKKDFGRKIAFEDLATGGSIMIFGPKRKGLDAAIGFLEFFIEESCGQCTPCREGTPVLLEAVRLIKKGKCSEEYFKDISSLAETMELASKCGLGQSSARSIMSILANCKSEYKLSKKPKKEKKFHG